MPVLPGRLEVMTQDPTEAFVAKVDAFAASLNAEEQAMLTGDDDEVHGFGARQEWPGLQTLGVWKAPAGLEVMSVDPSVGLQRPGQDRRIDLELK